MGDAFTDWRRHDWLHLDAEVEFQESVEACLAVKNSIGVASAAGIAMRNVLETLNGNLKQLARRNLGNSSIQKIGWAAVASAIAKGGSGSLEATRLAALEDDYNDLHHKVLTKIAKNDWSPTETEWDAIFARYITFLYTTLALIDFTFTGELT